jgi:hypothetical protein
MVMRVALAGLHIIGGEDRADEGDEGKAVAAAVGDGIDIPPGIATGFDGDIEARPPERKIRERRRSRSCISASAASRPEIAAIGTPAPGCVPPPAR